MATYSPSKITKDGNTYNFTDDTKIPLTGTSALAGSIIPSTDNAYDLGDNTYGFKSVYTYKLILKNSYITRTVNNDSLVLCGGTDYSNGAYFSLYGKDSTINTGGFRLRANDGINSKDLVGRPDGTLSWNGNIIPSTDNACDLGDSTYGFKSVYAYKLTLKNSYITRTVNNDSLVLCGGTDYSNGAYFSLYGKDSTISTISGAFRLRANDGINSKDLVGRPDGTLTWNGQSIQTTSDARLKQQITQIDDDLLTAWEDVNPVQFKYNEAVKEKSDNARLHTGYVVQQIDEACKKHNIDVSKYGLYCHEEYAEETREVEQADGTKKTEVVRPENEHYSLRYTEALIVECAYLRKKLKELTARIEQLEKGNNTK